MNQLMNSRSTFVWLTLFNACDKTGLSPKDPCAAEDLNFQSHFGTLKKVQLIIVVFIPPPIAHVV